THQKNGYASATVATDGNRVYVSFGAAGLFAFDLQGKLLWHADLGSVEHQWGAASSPVVFGNLVIQLCDSQTQSHLSAFDCRTGELVWQTLRNSRGCWSTPILVASKASSSGWQLIVNGT